MSTLPPVWGLYAATLPPIIYALFGTSRQLSVGPAALVSGSWLVGGVVHTHTAIWIRTTPTYIN